MAGVNYTKGGYTERGLQPGTKTLVVGLGATGLSCARYLAARNLPVAVADTRAHPPGLEALREEFPDMAVFLGGFEREVFEAAEQLVVSPGVSTEDSLIREARQRGVPVLGDVELFARAVQAPVIGITGSNGKSTVTSLVGAMARKAGRRVGVGGNLGTPVLDLLGQDYDLYVLELSSFQLETTSSLRPAASVVLNLSPDHLDRHGDFDSYVRAKSVIYRGAAVCVCNRDDPLARRLVGDGCRTIEYSLSVPGETHFGLAEDPAGRWLARGAKRLLPVSELKIPGRHNQANALAALALGTAISLPMPAMLEALREFPGLPHRTQFVRERRGVRWYNDSKATNVGACVAALEGLGASAGGLAVLIAGGDGKGQDFGALAPAVERWARAVVVLGRDGPAIAAAIGDRVPVVEVPDITVAVHKSAELARSGDCVLLAPACASFDQFSDYRQRGDAFVSAVRGLPE
jgi:UDP-N-acetylmuramoylalanine--D-glutamate ligase